MLGISKSLLSAAVAAAGMGPLVANAATTGNLLINGNAEQLRCTSDWTAQSTVPGWHVLRGAASSLCYQAFTYAQVKPVTPRPSDAGEALFAAPGADTAMEQSVDIGAAAAAVDRNGVSYSLSGWLGGWRDRPERATLTAIFLDANGNATGSPVVIADADADARGKVTGLVAREASGVVPGGTRQIVVTVHFLSGPTSFHNAYADNISLTLSGDVDGLAAAALAPPDSRVPPLDHVYVVMMENTNYADIVHTHAGAVTVDSRMPFLASVAQNGVTLTNLWGTYHPSDQNYIAMVAGDTFDYGPVYYPDFDLKVNHIGDLLDAKGKSWRSYVQHMNKPCNLVADSNGGWYAPDDAPFPNFDDVITNPQRCLATIRDLTDFESAIKNGTLPDFAWLAADGWWDGEGAWYENYDVGYSNSKQDQFLSSTLQPLLESAQWKQSRSLLIITWDEADGWGWPDNHLATFLVGSPGLLRSGTAIHRHYDGYDILRTIESALGLPSLDRFDQFAKPLNDIFAGRVAAADCDCDLWPAESVGTRGSIADTFGRATIPAAVVQGQPLTLQAADGIDDQSVVNLEPLGQVPSAGSTPYPIDRESGTVTIATDQLPPGIYGAWLRRGTTPPYRAPMMATVLSPYAVQPDHPGVEIIGSNLAGNGQLGVREGSNTIVHYCRPAAVAAQTIWIGVFAAGTPVSQLTQANANLIGYWLKTPGDPGSACGEAEAYTSELTPGTDYQIFLLRTLASGAAVPVGSNAAFTLTPALPQ
jgi:hypothetical protein